MIMRKIALACFAGVLFFFAVPARQKATAGCGGTCNVIAPDDPNIRSNGERIFLTGVSREGKSLNPVKFRFDLPDTFFSGGAEHKKKIESGALPCLRCHNFYGTGGVTFEYKGRVVKSSNLADIGGMEFSMEELRSAVSEGIGLDKRKLVPFMPRFTFTTKQLRDLKAFIHQLPDRLNRLQAEQNRRKQNLAF